MPGEMEYHLGAGGFERGPGRRGIGDVAAMKTDIGGDRIEVAVRGVLVREPVHLVARGEGPLREMTADEPGDARDENAARHGSMLARAKMRRDERTRRCVGRMGTVHAR